MLSALRFAASKAPRASLSFKKLNIPTMATIQFQRGWCATCGALSVLNNNFGRCDAASSEASLTGTVKWWDSKKGFGFITPNDGGDDVFVHQTEVHAPGFRSLADGEAVSRPPGQQRALLL